MAPSSFPTIPDDDGRRARADRSAEPGSKPPDMGEYVSTVLDRVRVELVTLCSGVLKLQRSLGPTLAAAAGDGSVVEAAQDLDLIAQSLDGLSTFLDAVVLGDQGSGRFDTAGAAAQVRLGALSARLAGHLAEDGNGPDDHGEVELF